MMPFGKVVGYHTCARTLGEEIRNGRDKLRPGANEFDWLGTGVYFWVGNYRLARWWINTKKEDEGEFDGVTLKYEIELGNCLNFSDAKDLAYLRAYEKRIDWRGRKDGRPVNERAPAGHRIEGDYKKRYLDHAVIDGYCAFAGECFDTVFGVFECGPEVYIGAGLYVYNNMQLAVREKGLDGIKLLGFEIP